VTAMLKIRTDQEDALADEDFVRRLVAHIQARAPDTSAKLTHRQLRTVVRHGIRVARTYDLESERDLAAFTLDMLAVNPEFHRQPELHAILRNPNIAREDRMDRVTAGSDAAWEEAATMTDPATYWDHVLTSEPADPGGEA
jgi:hypothetical protein